MQSHTRQSPGIEINEIDRSQYGSRTEYSVTGTTVLMTGFSDKGTPSVPTLVTNMNQFADEFGEPTNEPERYLYDGAAEIVRRGGRCVVAKLPYDNASNGMYAQLRYRVNSRPTLDAEVQRSLSSADPSLTSYFELSSDGETKLIPLSALDQYRVSNRAGAVDDVILVDVRRERYGQLSVSVGEDGYECLGLMPVFVGCANAMYYQGVISTDTSPAYGWAPAGDARNRADCLKLSSYRHVPSFDELFGDLVQTPFIGQSAADETVSLRAAERFPIVNYVGDSALERKNLKRVGLVVFEARRDPSNENRVDFTPVEAFVGSLDKRATDPRTGASDYLGTIVNASSKYVNLFSNVDTGSAYRAACASYTPTQTVTVLGFAAQECLKHIDYETSIAGPLTRILDACCDPNQIQLDLIADAGVSTLAQYAKENSDYTDPSAPAQETPALNADAYPYRSSDGRAWRMEARRPQWYHAVLRQFDSFCKYERKDCMFLADAYRPLVLAGNEKVVRPSDPGSSIARDIMPNLRFLHALDSSYSAGYANWFYQADYMTGDFFWVPPSVKAAGVYVYTDAYFHTWDAPAGLTRGVVHGAVDTAFDPRNDEAGQMYAQAWNYAVNYPVEGVVIEGQKTFQLQQTALDRVNVRRLMLYLEKVTRNVARRFLYEGNTPYLRQRFVDMITPLFEDAVNGKGVKEYAIRCDDELNTDDVVERNEMRCVIGIKPVKTVEWIVCDFIVGNQSASMTEEVRSV